MSKERLESLKRNKEWTEATGEKFYTVDKMDYEWLIKQAERAHELEQQNKRYREALSIISANLPLDGREHYVDIARQALEGDEE